MEIPAALASINAAMNIARTLRDIENKYDAAVLKASMADLYSALAEAKMGLSDLKDDLAAKDKEIEALTEAFERHAELVEGADRLSYLPSENGSPSGAPVCPKCLATNHRIVVTLQQGGHKAGCPVCDTVLSPVVVYDQPHGAGHQSLSQAREQGARRLSTQLAGRRDYDPFGRF